MLLSALNRLALAAVCVSLAMACNSGSEPGDVEVPAGEPEQYSATVVRSVDDGSERELNVTRIFKSGDLRRQEWTEMGESYALIWRPDLGKLYALDLERRCYVENEMNNTQAAILPEHEPSAFQSLASEDVTKVPHSSSSSRDRVDAEAVERALGDAPSADRVETRRLPDKTIDGHSCTVLERRAISFDNHVEVTTTFFARDLGGIAIRVETASGAETGTRLITTWRDIRLNAPADAFVVPSDFRRVDKLSR